MDLSHYDANCLGNPQFNLFGLPTTEEEARLVIVPVPWEVTVSYSAGTARAADNILKASRQVDLFDADYHDLWRKGFYLREVDKKILLKSDYLRKEAELYIDYISSGEKIEKNNFMCRSLKEINEGSLFLNHWVHTQTSELIQKGKLVALLGGDHSTPFGFIKALSEKYESFGILQIDAHCDLRKSFENFRYSHASVMYNILEEIPQVERLTQIGIRDFCDEEADYIKNSNNRIIPFFDKDIREALFEGGTWQQQAAKIIDTLPQLVHISFDVDGLDPKLCPNTGTPVPGGFEVEQLFYLFRKIIESGRKIIAFDLNEVGVGDTDWDANVGARILFRLCNLLTHSNQN
ncbi:agmatinase family protein [Flavihumibacter petaseus]|uniref:Putative agmatinase n=1 Tax=Flavihumibacter petaseus NBRC 106054 TaxID=1220578 RepID=A0A0E9N3D3_9BACT|nr:agmatinase family protein [Flavihumibacter petaseus]GAO44472.1 putative agmatinase [Flavihumibacter petaseus NBRC 106054]